MVGNGGNGAADDNDDSGDGGVENVGGGLEGICGESSR